MRISKKSSTFVALFIAKSGAKLQQKFRIRKSKVKNTNIFIVLALVLSSQWSVVAAEPSTTKANHYVGFSAEVGEWSLLPKNSGQSATFGGAGGAGIHYELQYGKTYSPARLLFTIGLGLKGGNTHTIQKSSSIPGDKPGDGGAMQSPARMTAVDGIDPSGEKDGMTTNVDYSNIVVRVPILVGMHYNRFYFLAGGKFDMRVWAPEASAKKFDSFVFNATAEIGGRLGSNITTETGYGVPQRTREYRFAFFADYGIGLKNQDSRNSLLVGVKFTMLFQIKRGPKSVINYDAYYPSVNSQRSGSTLINEDGYTGSSTRSSSGGVKYEE